MMQSVRTIRTMARYMVFLKFHVLKILQASPTPFWGSPWSSPLLCSLWGVAGTRFWPLDPSRRLVSLSSVCDFVFRVPGVGFLATGRGGELRLSAVVPDG